MHIIDKLSMDGINPSSCTILIGEWIPRLDADGFSTTVLTLRKPDIAGKYLEDRGIKVYYQGHGKVSFKNVYGIMGVMDQEKPDIVHLHGYRAANFGRIAARKKGVKNIVHEHAVLNVLPHQYVADFLLRNYTDSAIAVSNSVKEFMVRGRNIPEEKINVIQNGIRLDIFKKRDPNIVSEKRSELGIEEEYGVVGTVTRLRREKGVEYFIRSIPSILREFPETVFIIAGDGPMKDEMEQLVKNLDIAKQVKFLGFRKDVPDLLSIFDVNVVPSLSEGLPLSLIEAMAIGNAIVATEVGGLKEVGEEGKTVFFVPPKDPKAIAEKVCYLFKNKDICLKLSNYARANSAKYSMEGNALLLIDYYNKILK
jgi:glycosyltransferase involved in cell wall biosynthesis